MAYLPACWLPSHLFVMSWKNFCNGYNYGIIRIVDKVYELQDVKYYPVLVAHNGFNFDFLILLSELHRR